MLKKMYDAYKVIVAGILLDICSVIYFYQEIDLLQENIEQDVVLRILNLYEGYYSHVVDALILSLILFLIALAFIRKEKYISIVKCVQYTFAFLAIYLLVAGFTQYLYMRINNDPRRIMIIVNADITESSGDDADQFIKELNSDISDLYYQTKNEMVWTVRDREAPAKFNEYEKEFQVISDTFRLNRVLWINYKDNKEKEKDTISFYNGLGEFNRWSPPRTPISGPRFLYDHKEPAPNSPEILVNQTIAAIYFQTAIMYYEKEMSEEAWQILTEIWRTAGDENSPVSYLKQEPSYFYLLALLTSWAENGSSGRVFTDDLIEARVHLEEGKTKLSQEFDSIKDNELKSYYRLYLLQIFYTLNNVADLEKHFDKFTSSEKSCQSLITSGEDHIRLRALHKLKIQLVIDFPILLHDVAPESLAEQLVEECDPDSIDSKLLASQIHMDKIGGDPSQNLKLAWEYLQDALRHEISHAKAKIQLYGVCSRNLSYCKEQELSRVADWVNVWDVDIGADKRVFRFGNWPGYDNSIGSKIPPWSNLIPFGTQRLDATRKSNSTMNVKILKPANISLNGNYQIETKMTCGPDGKESKEKLDSSPSSGGGQEFNFSFGEKILNHHQDTFIRLGESDRLFDATCYAYFKIDPPNDQLKAIERNIWIIGRPEIQISESASDSSEENQSKLKVYVTVSFKDNDSDHVITFKNQPPKGNRDLTVRLCTEEIEGEHDSPPPARPLDERQSCKDNIKPVIWEDNKDHVTAPVDEASTQYYLVIAEVYYGEGEPILRGRKVLKGRR